MWQWHGNFYARKDKLARLEMAFLRKGHSSTTWGTLKCDCVWDALRVVYVGQSEGLEM